MAYDVEKGWGKSLGTIDDVLDKALYQVFTKFYPIIFLEKAKKKQAVENMNYIIIRVVLGIAKLDSPKDIKEFRRANVKSYKIELRKLEAILSKILSILIQKNLDEEEDRSNEHYSELFLALVKKYDPKERNRLINSRKSNIISGIFKISKKTIKISKNKKLTISEALRPFLIFDSNRREEFPYPYCFNVHAMYPILSKVVFTLSTEFMKQLPKEYRTKKSRELYDYLDSWIIEYFIHEIFRFKENRMQELKKLIKGKIKQRNDELKSEKKRKESNFKIRYPDEIKAAKSISKNRKDQKTGSKRKDVDNSKQKKKKLIVNQKVKEQKAGSNEGGMEEISKGSFMDDEKERKLEILEKLNSNIIFWGKVEKKLEEMMSLFESILKKELDSHPKIPKDFFYRLDNSQVSSDKEPSKVIDPSSDTQPIFDNPKLESNFGLTQDKIY